MNKSLKNVLFVLLMVMPFICQAQTLTSGYECLGTHCYITVYMNKEPVSSNGMFKFTIDVPQEGAVGVQGPATAYLFNNLGNTVDLYVRKGHLDMAAEGVNCEVPLELYVNKWTTGWGSYNTNGDGNQCFYWIKLMVNYDL